MKSVEEAPTVFHKNQQRNVGQLDRIQYFQTSRINGCNINDRLDN